MTKRAACSLTILCAVGFLEGQILRGAVLGAARKRQDRRAAEQAQAQQAQGQSQQLDTFFRAYGACLQGRGYTVN